jgi:peptidylprolyl isomerase
MLKLRHLLLIALAALSIGLAACGDDDKSDSASTGTESSAAAPADTSSTESTPTETSSSDTAAAPEVSKNTKKKPAIPKPQGDPPTTLVSKDIVKGKGKAAKDGDNVSVQYVGVAFSTGTEFDASWDRGQAFTFTLGSGNVIQGWDQGVKGMKEGGRRELVIPPDLAYGPNGAPPAIGPNETLVFVVDLENITSD